MEIAFSKSLVDGGSEQGDPIGVPEMCLCDLPVLKMDSNPWQHGVVFPGVGCAPPSQS